MKKKLIDETHEISSLRAKSRGERMSRRTLISQAVASLACSTLVLGLAGCGGQSGDTKAGAKESTTAAASGEKVDASVYDAADVKEVPVGILHSLSGTMAISEVSVKDAELMAIEEINAKGGVLGKKLKPVIEDGASDWPTFKTKAE